VLIVTKTAGLVKQKPALENTVPHDLFSCLSEVGARYDAFANFHNKSPPPWRGRARVGGKLQYFKQLQPYRETEIASTTMH
jgi:hypothetical protein